MIKLEEFPASSKRFDCREDVSPWFCERCGFSSHVLSSLIRHKEAGCGNNLDYSNCLLDAYKCSNCTFISCSWIIASKHETRCSTLDAPNRIFWWICSHCDFSISYKSLNLGNITFKCEDQDCYTSTTREELKQHATFVHLPEECLKFLFASDSVETKGRHTPTKNRRFECQECEYKSKTKDELRRHKFRKHTPSENIKWLECQECEFKCKTKDGLRQHKFYKHTPRENIKWRECPECEFKCKTTDGLRQHRFYKHTPSENIKWFECQECEFKSKTKDGLSNHRIRKHVPSENIKWFECEQCDFKCKIKDGLNQHRFRKHIPSHNIKWFECEECEFRCKTKSELNLHRLHKHIPSQNIKWLECQECEFKCKTKAGLNQHRLRKHTARENIE